MKIVTKPCFSHGNPGSSQGAVPLLLRWPYPQELLQPSWSHLATIGRFPIEKMEL